MKNSKIEKLEEFKFVIEGWHTDGLNGGKRSGWSYASDDYRDCCEDDPIGTACRYTYQKQDWLKMEDLSSPNEIA